MEKDILHYTKNTKYDFVDLGLSVKWASCNVGATKPYESGLYFAWGENKGYVVERGEVQDESYGVYTAVIKNADDSVTEKTFASGYADYEHYEDGEFTKYNATDTLTTLENEDDGCYLDKNYMRMPTKAECEELIANTESEWTENYNGTGIKGIIFISKNGNSIFVPAVGAVVSGVLNYFGLVGFFWSSSLSSSSVEEAFYLFFNSDFLGVDNGYRFSGFPLRAVRP